MIFIVYLVILKSYWIIDYFGWQTLQFNYPTCLLGQCSIFIKMVR